MIIQYEDKGVNHRKMEFPTGTVYAVSLVRYSTELDQTLGTEYDSKPAAFFSSALAAFEYVQMMNKREKTLNP